MVQLVAAKSDEVREGAVFAATLQGKAVALTRVNGKVEAFLNSCPHMGLKLTKGRIAEGVITCPFHGSTFDLVSGADKAWVSGIMGVKLPAALCGVLAMGKPPKGLTKFTAHEVDGTVLVDLD